MTLLLGRESNPFALSTRVRPRFAVSSVSSLRLPHHGQYRTPAGRAGLLVEPEVPQMKRIADLMKERGLREGRFVIIGGGPTSEAVRDYVGADSWALNPVVGINMCKEFLA